MTIISALKHGGRVYMASDRGATDTDISVIVSLKNPKTWTVGSYVMGYAGTMEGERTRLSFVPPEPDNIPDADLLAFMNTTFLKKLKKFYEKSFIYMGNDSDLCMLIGVNGRLFEHNASDMSIIETSENFSCIGSGASIALGYLEATKTKPAKDRVVGSVEAAIKYVTTCKAPIDFISL